MKKNTAHLQLVLAGVCLSLSCAGLPPSRVKQCERLVTGPGPEDFVLDRSTASPRILVSSHDRRQWTRGGIFVFDPGQPEAHEPLPREGEPTDLFFAPHGMDILVSEGRSYLFTISHGRHREAGRQQVLVYRILPKALRFVTAIESPLFTSPNDVAVDPAGGFYVSNDARSRGSLTEMLFALRRSSVVYCPYVPGAAATTGAKNAAPISAEGRASRSPTCIVAADRLAMANGVAVRGSAVFVSTTRGGNLTRFQRGPDGRLTDPRVLFSAPSLDNLFFLSPDGQNGARTEVLVASHPAGVAFLRHARDGKVPSPSVIYAVDIETGAARSLYANDGTEISAASGAFELDGWLYISQVFEPHLLRCSLSGMDGRGQRASP